MMPLTDIYLKSIQSISYQSDLLLETSRFIKNQLGVENYVVGCHSLRPYPFALIDSNYPGFEEKKWAKDFQPGNKRIQNFYTIEITKNYYFFLDPIDIKTDVRFIMSAEPLSDKAIRVLQTWNYLDKLLGQIQKKAEKDIKKNQANLLAQLLHDFQTLSLLAGDIDGSAELNSRLTYQKRTNLNLLFYLRDIELLPVPISVFDLIEASLDMVDNKVLRPEVECADNLPEINIDVELIARALNEIVKNAILSGKPKSNNIKIKAEFLKSRSPFHT